MERKISNSLKWSTFAEISTKIVAPIMNILLARILVPEDFGILASIMMIISLADLLTDSGFSKYIVQNDFTASFPSNYLNVAFWTNLFISSIMFSLIVIFRKQIALLVGSTGHELAISISSIQLLLTSFSSIQLAWLRRNFEFKKIFVSRIISSLIPLFVTLPLSILLRNYWAMVVGNLIIQLINSIILMFLSNWRPGFYFNFNLLQTMISYSFWSLAEALVFWLITWFDIFIIGNSFSDFYLGIYKNSLNTVNSLMNLVKASIIPVLFSALSRFQNNDLLFKKTYYNFQLLCSTILIPLGIGVYLYRDLATFLIFGSKWAEASNVIGSWALSMCIMSVFVNFYGEALKAKGLPKVLFWYELICLFFMVMISIYVKNLGFWPFIYVRSSLVVIQVLIGLYFMYKYINFDVIRMINNIIPPVVSSLVMSIFCILVRLITQNYLFLLISILFASLLYLITYYLLFKDKMILMLSLLRNEEVNL